MNPTRLSIVPCGLFIKTSLRTNDGSTGYLPWIHFLYIEKCEAIRCRKPIISQTLFSNLRYPKLCLPYPVYLVRASASPRASSFANFSINSVRTVEITGTPRSTPGRPNNVAPATTATNTQILGRPTD